MDLLRPINRENDVVEATGNDICFLLQQESGGEESDANAEITKELADRLQLMIEQRFASRKHDVLYSERSYRFLMSFEISDVKFAPILSLPDIAHHTAAIAMTVNIKQ
jgi:hypothetical protein